MTEREQLLGELRPVAFSIAYRMLGSVSEAEDVVQEALLRVHRALDAGEQLASPPAFVATITTRLAINELRSARARRERYVGDWLPEPIITDGEDDPAEHAEMADSLSVAMLVLLESLSPEQREELARRFFAAAERGDLAGLESLLAHDVELTGDGGGKVPALGRTLHGRSRVARTLISWVRLAGRLPGISWRPVEVNGGAGAVIRDAESRVIGVWALEIGGREITGIRSVVNPDKLSHLGPVRDFGEVLRSVTEA
jgi:RNA polymerase sigma factor (sigma-70 family)